MQGVLGAFAEIDAAVEAVTDLRKKNFSDITVFTPTPRHEFDDALGNPQSGVRKFTLIGGLLGLSFGYWIPVWISDYWPIVVGGKPIASWVPYTIIGFELMVLFGSLSTVFGMFALARIPRLTMTVGYDARFSHGDYGVWVAAGPDRAGEVADVLRKHGALEVRNER
jgi:Protein of unknown function (DUF3341)